MECQCETEDATAGWLNLQMGAFTVVGYLLYRFSQTLPALIRWPIRLFCSITGLSTLWSWVSRLVGTFRVIKNLYKLLSQFWHFLIRISSKFSWLSRIIKAITGSGDEDLSDLRGLRVVLLRACDDQTSSLANFLLGSPSAADPAVGKPVLQSTKRTIVLSMGEISIVDSPALPGLMLDDCGRAQEALRSLQLCSPGPHAFLIQTPILNTDLQHQLDRTTDAAQQLFGEEVTDHIIPVVTHRHSLSRRKIDHLLHAQPGSYKKTDVRCALRPEVVNISMERSADELNASRIGLLKRVAALKKVRGNFVHELQRREDLLKEQLLSDMAHALASKLRHTNNTAY